MSSDRSVAEKICLTCGLCCNGVIFADVQLQRGDNAERLKALGLSPARFRKGESANGLASGWKLPQPCAAYDGCHCRIYQDRPKHCRAFDCALLQRVKSGEVTASAALRKIEKTRALAEKVRELLRKLGDKDEHFALSQRFRRTAARLEKTNVSPSAAESFSDLTFANHALNVLLSEAFYPGNES